jgi:hypothetical protein
MIRHKELRIKIRVSGLKDKTLYHGSRGGIKGDIKPSSREQCDFGRGFYMGDISNQAKGLVIGDTNPMFYKVRLRLSEIPEDRILVLEGKDWLNAVLASRKLCEEFNGLELAKYWERKLSDYDVIIGTIADDTMKDAIKTFSDGGMTDEGLIACLQSVDYGMQYVAKTEFACSKIEILSQKRIYGMDKLNVIEYNRIQSEKSKVCIQEAAFGYCEGFTLDEILKREREKERKGEYGNVD